jgi:hypothetical protein
MERLGFELPAAFLADSEPGADLAMALGLLVVQSVVAGEHLLVAHRAETQERGKRTGLVAVRGGLKWIDRTIVGHEIAQHGAVLADWLVQGGRHSSGLVERSDPIRGETCLFGDRVVRRRPPSRRDAG